MGVSGCGKSSVGRALAEALGWPFFDADDFHPESNIRKMAGGTPLTDEDRMPWLERLRDLLAEQQARGHSAVLACSALRQSYRDILAARVTDVHWVHLHGTLEEVRRLMERRSGHFMKTGMLQSQFQTLELPANAIELPVTLTVAAQVRLIRERLHL